MGTERSRTDREAADLPAALIGRDEELGRLLVLVDGIRDHGGALVIRGEAGVGKSALLAAVSAGARGQGVAVFKTTAVESETHLPFAGLHELLLPFLDRLDRLPEFQRSALEMALGLAPREAVPDIFLIGLATLALVADVATEAPLLLIVEDAQWIDRSSGMVLGFVARRLEMEPVLMMFAVRAGVMSDVDRAGLPEFDLQSLSEEGSARLLDAQAPDLSAELKPRILDEALGNPLALIELPVAARDAAFDARSALPRSLPLTAKLERAFAARLEELDAAAALFNGNAPGVAWKTKPSWYIVATNDRTVQPDLERFVAKRMDATTYEVESSHVAMLSQPEFVLDVIRDAAAAIQKDAAAASA